MTTTSSSATIWSMRIELSKSAVTSMRPCLRNIAFIGKRNLRKVDSPGALLVGIAFHAGIAEYYKGMDEETVLATARSAIEERTDLQYAEVREASETAERLLSWYMRNADDGDWAIHAVETRFRVELVDGVDLIGVIDLVATVGGQLLIIDHKTTASIGSRYFTNADMDAQVIAYLWAARKLGIEADGFMFNAVTRTKTPQLHRFTVTAAPTELLISRLVEFGELVKGMPTELSEIAKLPGNGLVCRGCPFWELCLDPTEDTLSRLLASGELVLANHEHF